MPPRERMVRAAAQLLSERGLAGASFSEVIARSGAPRGSIYHHFPEGKDDLAREAVDLVGEGVLKALRRRDLRTPQDLIARFVDLWRGVLVRSQFGGGCAVAAVTIDQDGHPELGQRAASIFAAWTLEIAAGLAAVGFPAGRAPEVAALILAALEGALVLCRAQRTLEPLEAVERALLGLVARVDG